MDKATPTLRQRCDTALQSLPDAPYRAMLAALFDEMLAEVERLAAQSAPTEPVVTKDQRELIAKLRYMGKQYAAGQVARGGAPQKHYLEEAADEIEMMAWALSMNAKTPASAQENADLRNVIQAACIDGLPGLARAWEKYFPDHPITIKGAEVERLAAQAAPTADRWHDAALPPEIEQRLAPWLTNGAALHPATINLVVRFARALSKKLAAAETKYGYSDGWLSPDWMDECRAKLMEHIAKGDPRDVAAYCAFLWHHGASTIAAQPSQRTPKEVHVQADTIEDIKRAFSELSADKRIPADGKSTSGAQQSKGTPIMTTETATTPNTAAPTVTTILHTLQLPRIGTHWVEQGGIFAGILRGAPGQPDVAVIVPTQLIDMRGEWGPYGKDVPGATSVADSLANTRAMAEAGSTVAQQVLALVDDQGRSDYAIPAAGALAMCRANVPEHFEKDWHWSSTQDGRYDAVAQHFAYGSSVWFGKGNEFRVRPVRTIQLQHFTA